VVRAEAASGLRFGKHDPAATDTNATIEERCFLCDLCREVITRTDSAMSSVVTVTRVEAGSNTSTVTLRVVGGDEKGSPESETVKYGHVS
jgi:hypothetical protein